MRILLLIVSMLISACSASAPIINVPSRTAETNTYIPSSTPIPPSATSIIISTLTQIPTMTFMPKIETPKITVGYLWWPNDPTQRVYIIGDEHQEAPLDPEFAALWVADGTGCYATAGSRYETDDTVKSPTSTAQGIIVLDGPCAHFRGWVTHWAALHSLPPGMYPPTQPAGGSA